MIDYTIEIYKADKRYESGKRFVEAVEIKAENAEIADVRARELTMHDQKLTYTVHQTWHMVRNIMSGKMVKEHYTTPFYCSVASESYWCN